MIPGERHCAVVGLDGFNRIWSDEEAVGCNMKGIGQYMLDYDTNGLDEGFVGPSACHETVNVCINFREHKGAKGGKVVPGVAG
jgi:hypothetical protein